MKVPSQKELLNSPLFAVGLIFLAINLTTSHIFYEVSDYKTLLALAGAAFLALWYEISSTEKKIRVQSRGKCGLFYRSSPWQPVFSYGVISSRYL